jgi:hypothetical protein
VTRVIASGARLCAPYEPSPPRFDTVAASSAVDMPPPNGPCTIGCEIASLRIASLSVLDIIGSSPG